MKGTMTTVSLTPGLPDLPFDGSQGEPCIFLLSDGSLVEGVIVTLRGEKKLVTYETTYGPQTANALIQPLGDLVVAHAPCRGTAERVRLQSLLDTSQP